VIAAGAGYFFAPSRTALGDVPIGTGVGFPERLEIRSRMIMTGDLNVVWIHGAPDCAASADPPIQVYRFDADTVVLRQSKCSKPGPAGGPVVPSFEAPFLYLLFGADPALILDSGSSRSSVLPIAKVIGTLLADHAAAIGRPPVPLIVAHSYSHGDHVVGDD
jgi:hypothetical protein